MKTNERAVILAALCGLALSSSFSPVSAGLDPVQETSSLSAINLSGVAGNYLAGRYAQRIQDWDKASDYLGLTLRADPDNPELVRRAMVLAMGAGQVEKAIAMARRVPASDADAGALAVLFLALDDFSRQDYARARQHLADMPGGGMSEFVVPLLNGWAAAGEGRFDVHFSPDNPLYLYHAVLISDFLGRGDKVSYFLEKTGRLSELPSAYLETLGDICLRAGLKDKARTFYHDALDSRPGDSRLSEKLKSLDRGEIKLSPFVNSATKGAALALLDMAGVLSSEYSDDSARVFLRMALYLAPDLREARSLLVRIAARSGRYDEAIAQFQASLSDKKRDVSDNRFLAGLLEEAGRSDEALTLLEKQGDSDIDSLIQIGDLHRRAGTYKAALSAYDRAFTALAHKKADPGWELYYARGMVLERLGFWSRAESDLKAALKREPEHPYILNYLGYGWADRGENLEQALEMLRKAAALRGSDGYISDSLGWALFRAQRYDEAVAPMEKAVELVPYDSLINDHLGDVYWKNGRKREARFQWRRARNFSDNAKESEALEQKIKTGLSENNAPAASFRP